MRTNIFLGPTTDNIPCGTHSCPLMSGYIDDPNILWHLLAPWSPGSFLPNSAQVRAKSAQVHPSPHRSAQVRLGGARVRKKRHRKSPSLQNQTAQVVTRIRTALYTHLLGAGRFQENLGLCCCYCCCWRPLAPNRANGQQLLCAGLASVTSALAAAYQ